MVPFKEHITCFKVPTLELALQLGVVSTLLIYAAQTRATTEEHVQITFVPAMLGTRAKSAKPQSL